MPIKIFNEMQQLQSGIEYLCKPEKLGPQSNGLHGPIVMLVYLKQNKRVK